MAVQDVDRPGLWTRLAAALRSEVPAGQLEAFRRAGAGVFDSYLSSEHQAQALALGGTHPWLAAPGVKAQQIATWNAVVLQTVASALLDADYAAVPSTRGYVPPVTAEQAWALFEQVQPWLSRAREAAVNPAYRLDGEIALPADLPPWVEVEPCPRAHLDAMLAAARATGERLEAARGRLASAGPPPEGMQLAQHRLDQLAVQAETATSYAAGLMHRQADQRLHEVIEDHLHRALETQYHLGQLLVDPSLLERYDQRGVAGGAGAPGGSRLPAPGEPGFDPWVLTDPSTRAAWQRDRRAVQAIETMWRLDPQPRRTLELAEQLLAALARGDVTDATDERGRPLGSYYCCPWSAIYSVRRPLRLGGRRLRAMQQFALEVSAEEMPETGTFVRRVVVGPFTPTSSVDYCDPTQGGHDD